MGKKEERIQRKQWNQAAWDMLYLVQCGINSAVPDLKRVAKMDLEKVYARSKSQSLEALAYMALESLIGSNPAVPIADEDQMLQQWKEEKNKAIAKSLMMDAAREQLFAFLDQRGIWYVALKGVVLCRMYPKYGMRQMADNDILFDPSFRREVRDWFVKQGYEVKSFQETYHDEYHKKPVYNFEMHVSLFPEHTKLPFAAYYDAIRDRLRPVPGKAMEYSMTDEDCYLYIIAHEYKHDASHGTGLRSLLDLYIYQKTKDKLDWAYIDRELEKMQLSTYEKEQRKLARKLFENKLDTRGFTIRERELIGSLVLSRTYGAKKDFRNGDVKKGLTSVGNLSAKEKAHYLIRRLFPDKAYMEVWCREYAPGFLRHPALMPAAPLWRIAKRGMKKRKQIKQELEAVRKS